MGLIKWLNELSYRINPKKEFHPKTGAKIKHVFTLGGKDYYQLENDVQISEVRFAFLRQYYSEMEMRMTKESMIEFCEAIKKACNPPKGQSIEIGRIDRLADEMKDRAEWLVEPDSLFRFASVIYFTLDEDITGYDEKYNERKIKLFKKKDLMPILLERLKNEQLGLLSMSVEDLQSYLEKAKAMADQQLKFSAGRSS